MNKYSALDESENTHSDLSKYNTICEEIGLLIIIFYSDNYRGI